MTQSQHWHMTQSQHWHRTLSQHWHINTLSGRTGVRWPGIPKVARSRFTECSKSCDLQPALHLAIRGAQGGTDMYIVGSATSQFDLPSLTPLSIAGCGRLQLGAPHWATSVNYCKQLIIDPTFCGSRFSTGRLLAIEDFTFTQSQHWHMPLSQHWHNTGAGRWHGQSMRTTQEYSSTCCHSFLQC